MFKTAKLAVVAAAALAASVSHDSVFTSTSPNGLDVTTVGASTVGGGSAPGSRLPTALLAVSVEGWSAASLERQLRRSRVPVIARIEDDRVVLDLRTVLPEQDALLAELLAGLAAARR